MYIISKYLGNFLQFETFESWIVFKLPSNKLAKRLWKQAVEHHAFLRSVLSMLFDRKG